MQSVYEREREIEGARKNAHKYKKRDKKELRERERSWDFISFLLTPRVCDSVASEVLLLCPENSALVLVYLSFTQNTETSFRALSVF